MLLFCYVLSKYSLSLLFDYKLPMLIPLQQELTQVADEGVRQLVEETDEKFLLLKKQPP